MNENMVLETAQDENLADEALDRHTGGGRFSTCAICKVERT
ncbi:MAG: hypothetical protein O3A96_01175 [Proteobacteria bacterium]|nr:hypothetical protein [Pseudomonadota bacterium]